MGFPFPKYFIILCFYSHFHTSVFMNAGKKTQKASPFLILRHALLPKSAHFSQLTAKEPIISISGVGNHTIGTFDHTLFLFFLTVLLEKPVILYLMKLQKLLT